MRSAVEFVLDEGGDLAGAGANVLLQQRRWAIPDVLHDELGMVHELRVDLADIEEWHERARAAVWPSYPAIAAAETAIAAAEEQVDQRLAAVKAERVRLRAKRVTGSTADALRTARARLKVARAARKTAITAAKDEASERLTAIKSEYFARQKALYGLARDHTSPGLRWV